MGHPWPEGGSVIDARGWRTYVAVFHTERAGIAEDVLEHALDVDGLTAYDWAAQPVPPGSVVLDLACGSSPMHSRLGALRYLGLDLSPAELALASARAVSVAQADAARLPLADGVLDAVVMSMALMLVPLPTTLAEVTRVLRPGGVFVATVPTSRPLPRSDWIRYARLCWALRNQGLTYPNDQALAVPGPVFAAASMTLRSDEARTFRFEVSTQHDADQLLASLYLPDVQPDRMDAGRRVVRRWVGSHVTTPIRRLVATV